MGMKCDCKWWHSGWPPAATFSNGGVERVAISQFVSFREERMSLTKRFNKSLTSMPNWCRVLSTSFANLQLWIFYRFQSLKLQAIISRALHALIQTRAIIVHIWVGFIHSGGQGRVLQMPIVIPNGSSRSFPALCKLWSGCANGPWSSSLDLLVIMIND